MEIIKKLEVKRHVLDFVSSQNKESGNYSYHDIESLDIHFF